MRFMRVSKVHAPKMDRGTLTFVALRVRNCHLSSSVEFRCQIGFSMEDLVRAPGPGIPLDVDEASALCRERLATDN